MERELLLELADFLEANVPERKFNMVAWRTGNGQDEDLLNPECQTAGCAMGWACTIPKFQALGLTWDDFWSTVKFTDKRGDYTLAMSAAVNFFKLDYYIQAHDLFLSSSYKEPTVANVVARLRAFVNGSRQ